MFLDFNFQIEKNEKIRKNIRRISGAYENKLKRCWKTIIIIISWFFIILKFMSIYFKRLEREDQRILW